MDKKVLDDSFNVLCGYVKRAVTITNPSSRTLLVNCIIYSLVSERPVYFCGLKQYEKDYIKRMCIIICNRFPYYLGKCRNIPVDTMCAIKRILNPENFVDGEIRSQKMV